MTNTTIPPEAQSAQEPESRRHEIAIQFMPLLRILIRSAEALSWPNSSAVLFCIEIDRHWRRLAEMLMPGNEEVWETERASGRKPITIDLVHSDVCTILTKEFPDIANVILEVPHPGVWKGFILNNGGITVINIPPHQKMGDCTLVP
jgi:hypothetical protein